MRYVCKFHRLLAFGLLFACVDAHATDSAAGWSPVGEAVSEVFLFLDVLAYSLGVSLVALVVLHLVLAPLSARVPRRGLVLGMKVAAVVIPLSAMTVVCGMFGIEFFNLVPFAPGALLGGLLYYRASRLTRTPAPSAAVDADG